MIGPAKVSMGLIFQTLELNDCLRQPRLACGVFTDAKNKNIYQSPKAAEWKKRLFVQHLISNFVFRKKDMKTGEDHLQEKLPAVLC